MEKSSINLEARAEYLLENPRSLILHFGITPFAPILRLWEYPSFEPYKVWFISRRVPYSRFPEEYLVCRIEWNRLDDLESAQQLTEDEHPLLPNFIFKEASLTDNFVIEMLAELRSISIPLFLPESNLFALDGVRYGIDYQENFSSTRLNWWCDSPVEWKSLNQWHTRVRTFMEDALKSQSE